MGFDHNRSGLPLGRRRFLEVSGASTLAVGSAVLMPRRPHAQPAPNTVRWVSPRGTIEVLDDYPYWVGKTFGYFGDLETVLEAGPMDATATIKLVDQGQADMGFPSPGVFSLGLEQGIPLMSVFQMGAFDVFSFAFRKGEMVTDVSELSGKTILLGSIGWKAIVDPMLAQVGVDPATVEYAEAGPGWAQALSQGRGDAALSWEGLRAQWLGQGLDFDYILPYEFSTFPANTFVIRKDDFESGEHDALYQRYLQGWAMGLQFGHENPRAATHIVLEQFPALASTLTPDIATESMMQLAKVFRGDWETREGWGWHDLEQWQNYFDTIEEIGQITKSIDASEVISNKYIAAANEFDMEKVMADVEAYELPSEFEAVDIEAIRGRL